MATHDVSRRDMIRLGAAGLGAALLSDACARPAAPTVTPVLGQAPGQPFAAPPMETVRIGFVGVGGMGQVHCRNLLDLAGVELKALGDIVPEKVEKVSQWVVDAGQPRPAAYTRGPLDFERMCAEEELDLDRKSVV